MANATETFTLIEKTLLAISSSLVSLCCIGGNLLVLVAFCVDRGVRNSNNYFIISLAVTDLTIGFISLNLLTLYILLGYWPLGNFICDCWLAIDFTACWVSQVTVFLITLDRFMSVKFAVKYRNWRTAKKLKVMLTFSWLMPASLWIPMVFAWYAVTGEKRPPEHLCNVPFTHHTTFNTVLTVAYFWIPLCFMISLYVGIYRVAAGLEKRASATPRGLTDLIVMAGTTMSKIGLSVKVKVDGGYNVDGAKSLSTALCKRTALEECKNEHAMLKNKEDKNVCEQDPLVGIILDQQTDFMDSGLGESRDHRNTFDFSFNHKRRPSIISLEHPEFSDLYRCIISPNAPSSGSSSFGSEVDDPWTRLSDCQRALSYEAFDIGVMHQKDSGNCKATSFPDTQSSNNQRDLIRKYQTNTQIDFCCWSWQCCAGPNRPERKSSSTSPAENGSFESTKQNDTSGLSFKSPVQMNSGNPPILRNLQDRFMRFQTQKNCEKRKVEVKNRRRARKALRMISFILGAFVASWTPYHVIIIVKGFCDVPEKDYTCINSHLYNFAYYMCYFNSPLNPFCYAMANITFRRAFFRILKGDFRVK